jgi:hypothetical protein
MKTVCVFVQRLLIAFVAALWFFTITSLLTLLPSIIESRLGFKMENVSGLVQIFCNLVPLGWFPMVGSIIAFWAVFRASQKVGADPRTLCLCVFGFFVGSGMVILYPLLQSNMSALSAPEPSGLTEGEGVSPGGRGNGVDFLKV